MFMQSEQCNKQLEMLLQLHLQRVFTACKPTADAL